MVVESSSVIRNAKNARGLGRDTAPFPKSCASYFRFARFNTFPLYYLRAWHKSCASYFRFARFNTFPLYYLRAWHRLTHESHWYFVILQIEANIFVLSPITRGLKLNDLLIELKI